MWVGLRGHKQTQCKTRRIKPHSILEQTSLKGNVLLMNRGIHFQYVENS